MTFDREFLTSGTGQVLLVTAVLVVGFVVVRARTAKEAPLPAAKTPSVESRPKLLQRIGAKFEPPTRKAVEVEKRPSTPEVPPKPPVLALGLFTGKAEAKIDDRPAAPFGRLIPCRTLVALESIRLDTPIVGVVTEDVWHDGRRVIPAGAEVHGKALLDRTRERLGAEPRWHIVWRTNDAENGAELEVSGLVLDREYDAERGSWGETDGSAGLRGRIVKSDDERELKLFAATFLGAATSALQDQRVTAGLVGESSVPVASVRNAALAGTAALLRDYAAGMKEAIAKDGFYLRVPAGKQFYLYVTQTLDLAQARRVGTNPGQP